MRFDDPRSDTFSAPYHPAPSESASGHITNRKSINRSNYLQSVSESELMQTQELTRGTHILGHVENRWVSVFVLDESVYSQPHQRRHESPPRPGFHTRQDTVPRGWGEHGVVHRLRGLGWVIVAVESFFLACHSSRCMLESASWKFGVVSLASSNDGSRAEPCPVWRATRVSSRRSRGALLDVVQPRCSLTLPGIRGAGIAVCQNGGCCLLSTNTGKTERALSPTLQDDAA